MKTLTNPASGYEAIAIFNAATAEQGIFSDDPIIGDDQIHRIHIGGSKPRIRHQISRSK